MFYFFILIQGLLNINGLVGLDQKETSQVNEIKVTICNNMAAVYLKQRKHEKAITYCNKVNNRNSFHERLYRY